MSLSVKQRAMIYYSFNRTRGFFFTSNSRRRPKWWDNLKVSAQKKGVMMWSDRRWKMIVIFRWINYIELRACPAGPSSCWTSMLLSWSFYTLAERRIAKTSVNIFGRFHFHFYKTTFFAIFKIKRFYRIQLVKQRIRLRDMDLYEQLLTYFFYIS